MSEVVIADLVSNLARKIVELQDVAVAVQHFIAGSPGLIRELIDELKETS